MCVLNVVPEHILGFDEEGRISASHRGREAPAYTDERREANQKQEDERRREGDERREAIKNSKMREERTVR